MTTSSLGHFNNGFDHNEPGQLPLSARRLPPLDLKLLTDDIPNPTAKLKAETKNASDESFADLSSPKRHKKRRSKNRPTSAESKTSENIPGIIVSGEPESDGPQNSLEKSSVSQNPSPRVSRHNEELTPSARPKNPNRKVQVVADVEPLAVGSEMTSHKENHQTLSVQPSISRSKSSPENLDLSQSYDQIGRSASFSTLPQEQTIESVEDMVDLESTTLSASFTKAPIHSILKHSADSGSHDMDMFRADSRPNSANSSKPSVRIDDNVTYAGEPTSAPKSSRPSSAKKARPKSATKSHQNGIANGTNSQKYSRFRLTQTTQRKVSPHLKTSIFTMFVCGFFAGAVALFFSLRARKALQEGNEKQAAKDAWYSKMFNIIGIGSGLFIIVIVVIYYNIDLRKAAEAAGS